MNRQHPLLGIAFVLVSTCCFVVLDTTIKVLTASVAILMAVWFRYLCQALGMTLVVLPMRRPLRTRHPWLHVLRGSLLLASSVLAFVGLKYIPVADSTAIYMLTPLMVTLLAATFLGERVGALRWLLVAGGFVGALLVAKPGDGALSWAILLPLTGMLVYAVFQILTSRLARTEDPMVMHMYSGWVGMLAMSAILPWTWQQVPNGGVWGLLLLAGLMGTVGHLMLILAYTKAPAATLAPYMYMQIAIAMLSGWLVFGHVPSPLALVGMLLITVCGAAAAWLAARPLQEQPGESIRVR